MRAVLLFAMLTALAGCSAPGIEGDEAYAEGIVGSWILKDQGYAGDYSISLLAFTPEGRKCVIATDYGLGRGARTEITYWDNRWRIESGVLITTIVESSSRYSPPGSIIRDDIQRMDASSFDVLMQSDSGYEPRLEAHLRLVGEPTDRICSAIDAHFRARPGIGGRAKQARRSEPSTDVNG